MYMYLHMLSNEVSETKVNKTQMRRKPVLT